MDETVAELVCAYCAETVTLPPGGAAGTCPRCGHPLESTPPCDNPVAEETLIADLRNAFGFDGDADQPARPVRLKRTSHSSDGAELTLTAGTLSTGGRLGDFEILGELGRGGMGVVYRARQVSLGREVALKVLPGCGRRGRLAVKRFRSEAQAAARLHHTNVVSVLCPGRT